MKVFIQLYYKSIFPLYNSQLKEKMGFDDIFEVM